ncbi:ABC transporter substrate-binding protein [Marinicrinis sediminis]|uniref:ABC transporter substrate-binding protein n=1 Tax=Marinicrinis sediminis TaxID=1652465 RepID=A0ABW5R7F3_9BACL
MKKTLMIVSMMMVVLVMIAGCGGAGENNHSNHAANHTNQTNNEGSSNDTAANNTSDNKDVRVIQHAMGETTVEGTLVRVVTLYQGATDVAVALGVIPVGVVESWTQQPMYEYLRDELKDVPIVGLETQPNLEEISKLNPDLIIASKLRHEKVYEQLSQIAPTVTHETVYKFKDTVQLIGQATNQKEKADELLSNWNERTEDFKTKIATKLGENWPLEVSVLNFRTDHARIYVTGFAGDILSELGFVRSEVQQKAADDGNVVLKLTDKESIPSMDADVFFIFNADGHSPDAAMIEQTYKEWTNHPLWKNLNAVQNDQVTIVDEVAWNMGGGYISANQMLDQIYEHYELK